MSARKFNYIISSCMMISLSGFGGSMMADENGDQLSSTVDLEVRNSPRLYHSLEEKRRLKGRSLLDNELLNMGFLFEASAHYYDQEMWRSSGVHLDQFQWNVDSEINEYVSLHASLAKNREYYPQIDWQEAFVSFGFPESRLKLDIGRSMQPFGHFHSSFTTPSLVAQAGDTFEDAIVASHGFKDMNFSLAIFNGDSLDSYSKNVNPDFALKVGYGQPGATSMGVYAISDILETNHLQRYAMYDGPNGKKPGMGGWVQLVNGKTTFVMEYLQNISRNVSETFGNGQNIKIMSSEVSYAFNRDWEAALRYDRSHDMKAMPNQLYGINVSRSVTQASCVTLEYLQGKDDINKMEEYKLISVQLGLQF